MKFTHSFGLALLVVFSGSAFAAPAVDVAQRATPLAKVYTSCTKSKTVALTFDDGPWVYMYDISKALVAANATGTFFVNGNNYECIYDNNGKRIASHTWSHLDLTTVSWDKIHDEMWKVEQALQRIIGVTPAFMRPPYGNYNDLVRQASYIRGQALALWDFDSGDSTGSTPAQSKAAYKALFDKNPNNVLALNHETSETTAHQVIPYVISLLKSKGYKMVSLAECLGVPAYQSVGQPQPPSSSWHC
ncbi:Carbohydrate esterase 4 protein [Tulasnella sp. 403]|nr:Carbohydrate esterase 4 protein [Tulasnella sp. 403]